MPARRLVALTLPLATALTLSCGPGAAHQAGTVRVNGRVVAIDGVDTVGAALFVTSTRIPTGRLLSAVHRRSLGTDQEPGTVLVNGQAQELGAPLHDGDHVVTVRGPDAPEPLRTSVEPFSTLASAGLEVGGRRGLARVTRGAVSLEVVRRTVLSQPSRGRLPAAHALALTFDDGPSPVWTPRILALLARAHTHATFCLIGRQARQYPQLVKAIVAGGHTLCNHTWDHDETLPARSPAQVRQAMARAQRAIIAASGGVAPRLYRAPGGAWSPLVEATARSLGMTPLKWNVDPRDWANPGAGHIAGATLAQVRPGAIVLLHDGGGSRDQTYSALAFLLNRLPQLKYSFWVPQP